jgi:hypothetical protein
MDEVMAGKVTSDAAAYLVDLRVEAPRLTPARQASNRVRE